MVSIETFTFDYDAIEDRIKITGNLYNSLPIIHFWLTRKLTMKLLGAAESLVQQTSPAIAQTPVEHRSAMALFEHQSAAQSMDVITKPSVTSASNKQADIEERAHIQILSRLDVSHQAGRYKFSFYGEDTKPAAVSVINYNELHQVLLLIHRGAVQLDWGVNEQLFAECSTLV